MNTKNFVNFHILMSHSPSCLNRDDMNMQKTAIFGGNTRVRISSQSLKRAMRKSDYYLNILGSPSIRTNKLQLIKEELTDLLKGEFEAALIEETADRFVKASVAIEHEEDEDGLDEEAGKATEPTQEKKLAVAPWVPEEIRVLCRLVEQVRDAGLSDKEKQSAKEKFAKQKGKEKKPEQHFVEEIFDKKIKKSIEGNLMELQRACGTALDLALFGRMATSGLMTSVDGAMAVAHVITTHAVEPQDVDWFTAVDDLQEKGSGHLDTQQFSAGVFYRYASLNLKQLQMNLGLIGDMKAPETTESRARALEIAKHLFHMLATIVPSAMQGRHAAFNPADFAIVSFSDQPISLANAFEAPIQRGHNGGYLSPSMVELAEYWRRLNSAYGLDETAAAFRFGEEPWESGAKKPWPKKLAAFDTLSALEGWITRGGQA